MDPGRVLVADDDKNIPLTLATVLEEMGFEVEAVTNGWEAVYAPRCAGGAGRRAGADRPARP